MCFVAIICHVGIDVGINTTAPKILMERLGWTIEKAGYATSIYFIFRTIGCLAGSFIMTRIKDWHFLVVSIVLMALAVAGLLIGTTQWQLYAATALMGLANSNPFSIIMARALHAVPGKENEASGLMIMGLFGGTLFPIMMGVASDWVGQVGAIAVLAIGVAYLFVFWMTCKQTDKV
jgi:fucose permease